MVGRPYRTRSSAATRPSAAPSVRSSRRRRCGLGSLVPRVLAGRRRPASSKDGHVRDRSGHRRHQDRRRCRRRGRRHPRQDASEDGRRSAAEHRPGGRRRVPRALAEARRSARSVWPRRGFISSDQATVLFTPNLAVAGPPAAGAALRAADGRRHLVGFDPGHARVPGGVVPALHGEPRAAGRGGAAAVAHGPRRQPGLRGEDRVAAGCGGACGHAGPHGRAARSRGEGDVRRRIDQRARRRRARHPRGPGAGPAGRSEPAGTRRPEPLPVLDERHVPPFGRAPVAR